MKLFCLVVTSLSAFTRNAGLLRNVEATRLWEVLMRYKVKNTAALNLALGGLPDRMRVHADPDIGVSARTVGELRRTTTWPENLAVTTPLDHDHAVTVSRASSKRATPKP